MTTLDKRYYDAVLDEPDYKTAVYNFIKSLNDVEEVRYLWQKHFPDDSFINHSFGCACWARIIELEGEKNGEEKSES